MCDRDVRGLSHYDVFSEVSDQWKDAHRRGLAGDGLRAEADAFKRIDGTMQWVRWEIRPWYGKRGEVAGIVIFSEDVTERTQALEALRRSETAFVTLANLVPRFVWMCWPDGKNFYFNQRWVKYTGLTLEESYGTGRSKPFHPDDRKAAEEAWARALMTGKYPLRAGCGRRMEAIAGS